MTIKEQIKEKKTEIYDKRLSFMRAEDDLDVLVRKEKEERSPFKRWMYDSKTIDKDLTYWQRSKEGWNACLIELKHDLVCRGVVNGDTLKVIEEFQEN